MKTNSENLYTNFKARIFFIFSITLWIFILISTFSINYLNFSTVYYTINKDGFSLRIAEAILSGICHRMPSRSFWIFEVPLGLCSRCTGLYLSAFLTMIFLPFTKLKHKNRFLTYSFVGLLPLIIDGILEHFAVYSGSNILRFSTGIIFGFSVVAIFIHYKNQFQKKRRS